MRFLNKNVLLHNQNPCRCSTLRANIFLGSSPPLRYFSTSLSVVYDLHDPLIRKNWGTAVSETAVISDVSASGNFSFAQESATQKPETALSVMVVKGVSTLYMGISWSGFLPNSTLWFNLLLNCNVKKVLVSNDYVILETFDCGLLKSANYSDSFEWDGVNAWENISLPTVYDAGDSEIELLRRECESLQPDVLSYRSGSRLVYSVGNFTDWLQLVVNSSELSNPVIAAHVYYSWRESFLAVVVNASEFVLIEIVLHPNLTEYR